MLTITPSQTRIFAAQRAFCDALRSCTTSTKNCILGSHAALAIIHVPERNGGTAYGRVFCRAWRTQA